MQSPCFLFTFPAPSRPVRPRLRVSRPPPQMSGVNGGIDYQIDLTSVPPPLAARIAYVQSGPDSPSALIAAAEEIAAAAVSHPRTLPVLVDMLGFNNPQAARIAIAALVDAGEPAIPALLTGVAAFNYSVNAYALRALGGIGHPSVLQVCVSCAKSGPIPNVRRAACRALGRLRFQAAHQAVEAYLCLLELADAEFDWGVRYAAIVALEQFTTLHLLSDNVIQRGFLVVQAAAEGSANVLTDSSGKAPVRDTVEVLKDPTVVARATVAIENMRQRCKETAWT